MGEELCLQLITSSPERVEGNSSEEESEDEYDGSADSGGDEVIEELPESVISCLQFLKQRSEGAEKIILQDLESNSSDYYADQILQPLKDLNSGFLAQLASEYNEDPDALVKRVLADVEDEDERALSSCHITENLDGDGKSEEPMLLGDGSQELISFCYVEVEKNCRQKLQQWEEEQEKHNEMKSAALIAQKAVLQQEIQEQDEKRENWKKEFEKELSKLNILQKEHKEKLDADVKRKNDALAEELRNHQSLIEEMDAELTKEKNIFEQQKAMAEKCLEELQCKSAVKIQAVYRAHRTYKKYSPVLKERKEDLIRKKETQKKMEREKKELEEKVKLKLEEKKRKEEERRLDEEITKKKMEEALREEIMEQERRQSEYEKKKKEEKQRLEQERLFKKEESKRKSKISIDQSSNGNLGETDKVEHKRTHTCPEMCEKAAEDYCNDEQKQSKQDHPCSFCPEIVDKVAKDCYEEHVLVEVHQPEENINECSINEEVEIDLERLSKIETSPKENLTDDGSLGLRSAEERQEAACELSSPALSVQTPLLEEIENGSVPPSLTPSSLNYTQAENITSSISGHGTDQYQMRESAPDSHTVEENIGVSLQSRSPVLPTTSRPLVLSDHIEEKRLAWMKSCKPWSKILRDTGKNKATKKTKQRKSAAVKKLPPINETLILRKGPWNDLQQVTTVTLSDLPGCSLSTLSKCENLKYLSMRSCGLHVLDGITNCKQLQYIDMQENCISVINCEDLENVTVLLLNKNQITSIHGLDNCKNLMRLELSFNLITRVSGLDSLRSLQRLVLDHNQLISTRGLEATPMLTFLDCSYNYLTELEGIQNCGLLQVLKLQGNNLSEVPRLDNHVLLREIYLDDNTVTTLKNMPSYWLPLLRVFAMSKNSLTHLASLNSFISLEDLDLSSNCVSDLQSVTLWLEGCMSLSRLSLNRNPCLQEASWRCTLLKLLPTLKYLNDEKISPENSVHYKPSSGSFLALCQAQISSMCKLWKLLDSKEIQCSSLERLDLYCNTLKELFKLSTEHRYAHEYGDTEVSERDDPEVLGESVSQLVFDSSQQSSHIISSANEDKHDHARQIILKQAKPLADYSLTHTKKIDLVKNSRTFVQSPVLENSIYISKNTTYEGSRKSKKPSQPTQSKEINAAIRIQSLWRGYIIRRDICFYAKLHEAASIIQSAWRNYCRRRKLLKMKHCPETKTSELKMQAATVIQAAWKGFFLRKRMAAAFSAIKSEELDDEFEEVNLDHFVFDEDILEKGWSLDSTASHHGIIHLSNKAEQAKMSGIQESRTHYLPWIPQEAWSGSDAASLHSGVTQDRERLKSRLEQQNLSHVSSLKSNIDVSFKSEKEEKISQEWGFKDAATAQMMLRRAQKMKSKQAKHKRMLDPAVRLALFKNNENKQSPVIPPKKTPLTKIAYFQAVEEESSRLHELSSETLARSRELTYQWLHTQCGDSDSISSTTSKCKRFLPELNHEVLNGGRVQLVANPVSKDADDIDLVSVKSGSTLSQHRAKHLETQRAPSSSSISSNRNECTPLKINSGPQRKERISFRDNPVQLSGGWGSGKKKGKLLK
ncbi:leucine-rich repeat and IQ domain-containing protein 1 isoform X1 [Hyperolius riggenbachi]|uniref:leucine-rich repeat and IQ domain-containing protein 1 isoform X1 n=1 Tax=Hyperolius riggenbachi TaxID=752182 RepID=UPI0035A30AB9